MTDWVSRLVFRPVNSLSVIHWAHTLIPLYM